MCYVSSVKAQCGDCSCARVECASYCGGVSLIKDFTCDEQTFWEWLGGQQGQYLCECKSSSSPLPVPFQSPRDVTSAVHSSNTFHAVLLLCVSAAAMAFNLI